MIHKYSLTPLLQGFNSSIVCFMFLYSCLLFNMCMTYAERESFVFMYLACSLCLIPNDLAVCPKYELLQAILFNLCIPLELVLFWIILSLICLYMLFAARKAMFKLVCLNRLVTLYISWLWKVNVIHFFLCCVFVVNVYCVLVISLFLRLGIIGDWNPLFLAMVIMEFNFCCLALLWLLVLSSYLYRKWKLRVFVRTDGILLYLWHVILYFILFISELHMRPHLTIFYYKNKLLHFIIPFNNL